jgi:hypothetical protein
VKSAMVTWAVGRAGEGLQGLGCTIFTAANSCSTAINAFATVENGPGVREGCNIDWRGGMEWPPAPKPRFTPAGVGALPLNCADMPFCFQYSTPLISCGRTIASGAPGSTNLPLLRRCSSYCWIGHKSGSGFSDLAPLILHYNWF